MCNIALVHFNAILTSMEGDGLVFWRCSVYHGLCHHNLAWLGTRAWACSLFAHVSLCYCTLIVTYDARLQLNS